jgi:hypothetical protein
MRENTLLVGLSSDIFVESNCCKLIAPIKSVPKALKTNVRKKKRKEEKKGKRQRKRRERSIDRYKRER